MRKLGRGQIKISGDIERKIERVHSVSVGEVYTNLESPVNLISVEPRKSGENTIKAIGCISRRRRGRSLR